ncbi:MAG TPA: sulfatase-like hydrolase/transferase [Blastocatellia bacterium]|nr:sulfatase-like hydrolase/transferase [Blastocatellia bacterium]
MVFSVRTSLPEYFLNTVARPESEEKDLKASLLRYAMLGAAAAILLGLIEWVDMQLRLTPVFESFAERIVFTSYFSLNVIIGALAGLLTGLFVHAATFMKDGAARLVARSRQPERLHNLIAGFLVLALAAILFKQQPDIHKYLIGLLREAEKIDGVREFILSHERSISYAVMFGYLAGFWLLWRISRCAARSGRALRAAVILGFTSLIAVGYYLDSRIEVQRYEPSLHWTLFMLNTAFMMTVAGVIYLSWRRLRSLKLRPAVAILAGLVIIAAAVFTFISFDRNQNLKTQVLLRTTQTRQHVNMIRWAIDFDRDDWSAVLGGGDADDGNPDINPEAQEVIGDDIDNNCTGDELSWQDLEAWHRQFKSAHTPPDPNAQRLNVIHIFVDTLRADRLGVYGYQRNISPNIDKLAEKSQVFDNGFTPSPNTYEALPKFTQGAYWDAHLPGWPQILADNGYETLLFPRRITTLLRHVKAMKVVEEARVRTYAETIDAAIKVLGGIDSGRPFAAYLYSTDPHLPYRRHKEFDFGNSADDLYDGEVAYFDHHTGRLLDWMESAGRMNDTMIVIMSDHGESLGERGIYKHSTQLYNEQAQVPFIIYAPNLGPSRIPDYVTTVDLSPTILNAVGLAHPEECAGVSLLPLMRGEPFTHPPVYGEQTYDYISPFVRPEQTVHKESKKYMVITQDGYKMIFNRNAYSFELFNLKEDRREERNLYDTETEKAAEMRRLIGCYVDVVTASRPPDADERKYFFGIPRYEEEVK